MKTTCASRERISSLLGLFLGGNTGGSGGRRSSDARIRAPQTARRPPPAGGLDELRAGADRHRSLRRPARRALGPLRGRHPCADRHAALPVLADRGGLSRGLAGRGAALGRHGAPAKTLCAAPAERPAQSRFRGERARARPRRPARTAARRGVRPVAEPRRRCHRRPARPPPRHPLRTRRPGPDGRRRRAERHPGRRPGGCPGVTGRAVRPRSRHAGRRHPRELRPPGYRLRGGSGPHPAGPQLEPCPGAFGRPCDDQGPPRLARGHPRRPALRQHGPQTGAGGPHRRGAARPRDTRRPDGGRQSARRPAGPRVRPAQPRIPAARRRGRLHRRPGRRRCPRRDPARVRARHERALQAHLVLRLGPPRRRLRGGRGGTAQEVQRSAAGLLVAPEDPAAVLAAVRKLIEEPAAADELGSHGPQYVARHLGREAGLARFDALLAEILQDAEGRDRR